MATHESPLSIMDDVAEYVALVTGFRQQLIDQGWSQEAAELIVVRHVQQAG